MKCPKCGYHSFEHLDSCKKCGQGLIDHRDTYKLRGCVAAGQAIPSAPPETVDEESLDTFDTTDNESVDFGFDFLDEEEDQNGETPESVPLVSDKQEISLDQPFSVDSEAIPDDAPPQDKEKSEKGPEFAF